MSDINAELEKLRDLVERLRCELDVWRASRPGWVYSPKGNCLYDCDDIDRGDEF